MCEGLTTRISSRIVVATILAWGIKLLKACARVDDGAHKFARRGR